MALGFEGGALKGILTHCRQGLTTTFLEGLTVCSRPSNEKLLVTTPRYQTAMPYFVAGKLEIPYYGRSSFCAGAL